MVYLIDVMVVRLQVFTAASMKMKSLLEYVAIYSRNIYRRFRGTYCLIAQMIEAVSTSETSVSLCEATLRHTPQGCHFRGYGSFLQSRKTERVWKAACGKQLQGQFGPL
jgi:hypothetical protein